MTEKGTSIPIADPKNIKKFRVPVERFAWPDLCYSLSISLCLISAVDGMVCGCFAGELSRLMSSSSMGKRTHESSSSICTSINEISREEEFVVMAVVVVVGHDEI